jgi:hypothetical protein
MSTLSNGVTSFFQNRATNITIDQPGAILMYGQERASVMPAIAAVSLAFVIFAFLAVRTRAAALVTHVNAFF